MSALSMLGILIIILVASLPHVQGLINGDKFASQHLKINGTNTLNRFAMNSISVVHHISCTTIEPRCMAEEVQPDTSSSVKMM